MAKLLKEKYPCLNPKCASSDARRKYDTGTSFCFSCQTWFGKEEGDPAPMISTPPILFKKLSIDEIKNLKSSKLADRKISKEVLEFYGVKVSFDSSGEITAHYYPYDNNECYKRRELPKSFSWVSKNSENLFGIERFVSGGKRVIICEGEIDALSLAEASYKRYGKFYPIVALSSSAMAHKSILANRDWVKSFKEVVLCFDEDDAGNKAKNEAIKIVGADKVRLTKLPENDASDVIKLHGNDALMQCVFDAEKYVPSGIITKEKLWERLVVYNNTESIPYPECISGINTKLKGMRFGEITLFTSGTSCGKSTMLREIILHIIENTTDSVGVVSLEESPEETARKLAGMVLMKNPAKEELTLEELKPAFDRVFENDRIVLLDHQGGMKDDSILDKLEYMALSGCKYIFIDHITILVSEGADGLTGNEAIDKVMNDLLKFVKRFPVWVGLVSHLRKTSNTGKAFEEGKMPTLDDIKGSGSIKQISMDIVAFARNLMAEDPVVRNTIEIASLKCRFTGLTGFVSGSYYDFDTGRLKHVSEAPQLFTKIG